MNSIQDDSVRFVEDIIQKLDPPIKGTVTYLKSGWDNLAFAVGEHIVRFPQNAKAYEALCREEQFCQYVRALMPPLETPDLTLHEIDGYPFSLHRRVGSGLFTRKKYDSLTEYEKDETAEKLAVFFNLMHETSLGYAETVLNAPQRPEPSCFARMARIVDEKLDPDLREFGHAIIREYQAWNAENQNLVFGHFDLHEGNVGADSNGRFVGAFDFADCAVGDIHADFAPLHYISSNLVSRMAPRYEAMTGIEINPRRIVIAGAMCEISDLAGDRNSPESPEFVNKKLNEWRAALSEVNHASRRIQVAYPGYQMQCG